MLCGNTILSLANAHTRTQQCKTLSHTDTHSYNVTRTKGRAWWDKFYKIHVHHPLSRTSTHTLFHPYLFPLSTERTTQTTSHLSYAHTDTLTLCSSLTALPLSNKKTISTCPSSSSNCCHNQALSRNRRLSGANLTISSCIYEHTAGFHQILSTLWWRAHHQVPSSWYEKLSVSKYPKLAGAPHHKVLKNVKLNALCHGIGNLMVRSNGDRVRYIKYEIPCNAIVRHEKLDTLWRSSCTAMPVFCQRTIGRNLKGYIVKASTWLYNDDDVDYAWHGTAIRGRRLYGWMYGMWAHSYMSHWYNLRVLRVLLLLHTDDRRRTDRRTDGRTNEWTDSRTDRRMDGWMAGWLLLGGRTYT